MNDFFNKSYYESGPQSGKSLYQNYRWIPELTIPLAHHVVRFLDIQPGDTVMDFGCAKGYLVYALKLLGVQAHGVDISKYAISQSPKEINGSVKAIEPYSNDFIYSDYLLAKDILEHIPYDSLDRQMEILRERCKHIFAIIPLGKNGKYIIPAYEMDQSHYICEDIDWWKDKFKRAGFNDCSFSTDLGAFKQNWQEVNDKGNLLAWGF